MQQMNIKFKLLSLCLVTLMPLSGCETPVDNDFNIESACANATTHTVNRGPYIQSLSDSSVVIKWRSDEKVVGTVAVQNTKEGSSRTGATGKATRTHAVEISELIPGNTYHYEICGGSAKSSPLAPFQFQTAPVTGTTPQVNIWAIGDSGTADEFAQMVYDAYLERNPEHTDVWLMLGDNAYIFGTDDEYQAAVFDMYTQILPNTALWPVLGNHDAWELEIVSESGVYFDIFSLPTRGQAGGVASGKEAYYSFDYGNVHFVALDSQASDNTKTSEMLLWLEQDLAFNQLEWVIAFMHHPPYTKGTHDSDTEQKHFPVRENMLPVLEKFDVDLVLSGHSHSYERTGLIQGHYDTSDKFDSDQNVVQPGYGDPVSDNAYRKTVTKKPNGGTVYAVVGSSGKAEKGPLGHPAVIKNFIELGSLFIQIDNHELDAEFLTGNGEIFDNFEIVKQ